MILLTVTSVLLSIWLKSGQWFGTAIVFGITSFIAGAIVSEGGDYMENLIEF